MQNPTKIYCDNAAAIELSKNPVYKFNTKHIDIKYHYVREVIKNKEIVLEKIDTKENLADIMTKPLFGPLHQKFTSGMGLHNKDY